FAPEERAGDAARGVQPLFVIHAQREKVDALARLARHGRRRQQHGFAAADDDRAAGQLGQLAGLERDRATTQGGAKLFTFWHSGILHAKRRSDKRRTVPGTEVRDWELPTNARVSHS